MNNYIYIIITTALYNTIVDHNNKSERIELAVDFACALRATNWLRNRPCTTCNGTSRKGIAAKCGECFHGKTSVHIYAKPSTRMTEAEYEASLLAHEATEDFFYPGC